MTDRTNAVADELRACSELDSLLLDELSDLLNEAVDKEDTTWMQSSLSILCETVDREFALEDGDGYLATVLEEFPNWDNRVEALRQQRDQLHQRLHMMRMTLGEVRAESRLVRGWRDTFRQWILEYSQHRRAERDILQEAVVRDIGVGD